MNAKKRGILSVFTVLIFLYRQKGFVKGQKRLPPDLVRFYVSICTYR